MSSGKTVMILLLGIIMGVSALLVYKTLEIDREMKKIKSLTDVDEIKENRTMFREFEKKISGIEKSIKDNSERVIGAEKNIEVLENSSKAYFELFAAEKERIMKISSELEKLKKEINQKPRSEPTAAPEPGSETES
ncbi:MAG: hypothetical protein ACLFP1_07780 [Candidatus Goldiibacteriota bacterium]